MLTPTGYFSWFISGAVIGKLIWLLSDWAMSVHLKGLTRVGSLVVIFTPLIYLGHPLIFRPLWMYVFNGVPAAIIVMTVWAILTALIYFFLRKR